jgi:hypothetical protein
MPRHRPRPAKPIPNDHYIPTWLDSLPVPEVREGGESTWDLWHEAARQLDAAFAPTQPSDLAPLSVGTATADAPPAVSGRVPLTADALMVIARRNNRVCPQPPLWMQLHHVLEGSGYADLPPPPVERWIWSKLSDLQKRLRLREYIEWAERHGKLPLVKKFIEDLAEADWVHMGDA